MKLAALLTLTWAATLASDVLSFSRLRNALTFVLDDGRAEIEWITASTVRMRRGALSTQRQRAVVEVSIADTDSAITARSRDLTVSVRKKPFEIVLRAGDEPTTVRWGERPGNVAFDASPGECFYGLGPRQDPRLDARGLAIKTGRPFLLSSRMYGLYVPRSGEYSFDVAKTRTDAVVVQSPGDEIDFFYYSGAGLKEVLEQHHYAEPNEFEFTRVDIRNPSVNAPDFAFVLPREWPASLHALLNASLSGMVVPAALASAQSRLAALMPVSVADSDTPLPKELEALRSSFQTHLLTYVQEARDRGLPAIHPLPLQFPRDAKAATIANAFMFGDEILVATEPELYLPQGFWTDLESGKCHRGRTTIRVSADARVFPMFARNGSIVPRDRDFGVELHYFPKLGAEYFIPEVEPGTITQIHAGPSAEVLRLEIEASASRGYEWVIHHVARPSGVTKDGQLLETGGWRYDEKSRRLHIRTRVSQDTDTIWNVTFARNEWYTPLGAP